MINKESKKVYALRTDGTGGEELGDLFDMEEVIQGTGKSYWYRSVIAHRGYVYIGATFYTKEETILEFARLPITGGKKEVLYQETYPIQAIESNGSGSVHVNMSVYLGFTFYFGVGSKIYFVTCENKNRDSKIFCYDTFVFIRMDLL